MADPDLRFRPALDGSALVDSATGLAWEASPASAPVRWQDALASASAEGWRLPTASELMGLLSNLPASHPFPQPGAGDVFWSASESPFAPATRVRVVEVGADHRPAVVLLDKSSRARPWRVRDPL
ncbi:MAG: DUF1566 domain-containing protein [Thermodesulfobacteriota bacterium]